MKKILLAACLVLCVNQALASNDAFMVNTAIGNFTDQDTTIFTNAVQTALNHNPNGKKLYWKNPQTHAMGYVMPLNTTQQKGTQCRDLQIFNEAKGVTGESKFSFCKVGAAWKIVR